MFLKGLKRKSAEKAITKLLNSSRTVIDKKIRSIGVLVDASIFPDFPFLKDLAGVFNIKESEIEVLYYHADKRMATQINGNTFSDADLGFGGKFKGEAVNDFVSRPFDALINYYDQDELLLNLVALQSKAEFKIGFAGEHRQINDFSVVTSPKEINLFVTELKKYLPILNKI